MTPSRHKLKVDTFPFLAVLLCAMGALILVLLAMDRKSRLAARAKAEDAARQQTEGRDAQIAARRAEQERRKAEVLAGWERQRDQLRAAVDAEEAALDAELRAVRASVDRAARALAAEVDRMKEVRRRLAAEAGKLAEAEAALAAAHNAAGSELQRIDAGEAARTRLVAELEAMERKLKEIEAGRKRDEKAFSLVPYGGKRGSSQQPVYVECAAAGLLFHPDRKRLSADDAKAMRAEVVRRLSGRADPYLMMLVRPDGVEAYYSLRKSVNDLDVTFGYELVDATWEFHVPDEPATPPATAAVTAMPTKPRLPAGVGPNLSGVVNIERPRPFGPIDGAPAGGEDADRGRKADPGHPERGEGRVARVEAAPRLPEVAPPVGVTGPGPGGLPNPDAPLPGVAARAAGTAPTAGSFPEPRLAVGPPGGGATPGAADPKGSSPGKTGPTISVAPMRPGEDGPRIPELPEASLTAKPRPPREPLRHARIESNEVSVFVECCAGYVVVYPGRKVVKESEIAAILPGLVMKGLNRPLLGGGVAVLQVRLLVRPDGERTFHDAWDAVRVLRVATTQYRVQPDDDVARLVGSR